MIYQIDGQCKGQGQNLNEKVDVCENFDNEKVNKNISHVRVFHHVESSKGELYPQNRRAIKAGVSPLLR